MKMYYETHKYYKRCTYCGLSKLATPQHYHRQTASSDGLKNICKVCVKYDRINHPPKPLTGQRLRQQIELEDNQRASENRARLQASEIQVFKDRILQAAIDADYASIGIWLGGLLINIPIKVCVKCEQQFPETTDYFYMDNRSNKYRGKCKLCLQSVE
jgi:hypothetical protein